MPRRPFLWAAKYLDAVVLVCYAVALLLVGNDSFGIAIAAGGQRQAFIIGTTAVVFLLVSLHGLYAAAYVFVHTERAVEHHVRPFSYRLGIENSDWLYRRLTDYDDEAGARRAALFMVVFSGFTLVCTLVGAVTLLAT